MSTRRRVEFKKLSWQYMACLTDGEGHIYVRGLPVRVTWSQSAKNAFWLDHVAAFLDEQDIAYCDREDVASTGHPYRSISVSAQDGVTKLLQRMKPYLILKEEQARMGLIILAEQKHQREVRQTHFACGHRRSHANSVKDPSSRLVCRTCLRSAAA